MFWDPLFDRISELSGSGADQCKVSAPQAVGRRVAFGGVVVPWARQRRIGVPLRILARDLSPPSLSSSPLIRSLSALFAPMTIDRPTRSIRHGPG